MRKKIIFLLLFLVFTFSFCKIILADDEACRNGAKYNKEFRYDIETLSFDNNTLSISGWAFFHNINVCGGKFDCESPNRVAHGINFTMVSGTIYKMRIKFSIRNSAGVKLQEKEVEYLPYNLFGWMCTLGGGACIGNMIDNAGFRVNFDLSTINADSYNIYIYSDLVDSNGNPPSDFEYSIFEQPISVAKGVVNGLDSAGVLNLDDGTKVEVSGFAKTLINITNKRIARRQSLNGNTFSAVNGDFFSGCLARYDFSDIIFSNDVANNYTFDDKYMDYHKVTMYKIGDYWGFATWFTPSGKIVIKKESSDKYCAALNNDASISDCEGATEYSCNAMTVKSGNISADVTVSEHAELSQDQYYPSIIIPAGSGFKYGATYVDTVTWKIVKRNYDGNTYDNEICKLLTEGNKYYNKISLKDKIIISDKFNLNSDGSSNNENLGKAGYWTEKWETGSCSITHTLKYEIGKASYNIKQSKIEYSSAVAGGVYYVPLKMCIAGSNEGVFSWNVTSTGNVASAKVRTGKKENNIQSVQFDINTGISGGGSACKILVKKSLHDCESTSSTYSGDSTSLINEGSLKYLPVYRTIDEKFAFPKSRPDNWVDYANKINAKDINSIPRITNILDYYHSSDSEKYAMDEYVTQVITKSLIKNYLNNASYNGSYSSWDDINNVGKNNTIITSDTYFAKRATKICKIGEYSRECDAQ